MAVETDPAASPGTASACASSRLESASGTRLKKGIEYCNLGGAQFMLGRIREAYRSFELAEEEDHAWGQASHAGLDILEGYLLLPAGDALVGLARDFAAQAGLPAAATEAAAQEFWVTIGRTNRLGLREAIPDLLSASGDTASGRAARLTALGTLARVTETVLRQKHLATLPAAGEQELLRAEFGNAPAKRLFHEFVPAHGKVDPRSLDRFVSDALALAADPLTRSMVVFYVVRNYTAHYWDVSPRLLEVDATFLGAMQHLAFFATRIATPKPVEGVLSYPRLAALPPGNFTSEYGTRVWAVTSASVPPSIRGEP
jgi:hypothetical protein